MGEKLEGAGNETASLEVELANSQKELEASREEARQSKRRVEALRQENGELEVELKRQMRLVEEAQERADEFSAKIDEVSKDRLSLQTRLNGAKSENEMLRRENEKLMITQKDVGQDKAGGRRDHAIRDSKQQHKAGADKEARPDRAQGCGREGAEARGRVDCGNAGR